MASGTYSDSPLSADQRTVVERWNGHSWALQSTPNLGNNGDTLEGLSCTSPTSCMAVGSYTNEAGFAQPLIERWNGRAWALMPIAPPPGSRYGSDLTSVSCPSATLCMAAGAYTYAADHNNTLLEEWNGTSWAIVSSPSPYSTNNLLGVSCSSATFCMAVGSYQSVSGSLGTLVEEWNGRSWASVSSPSPGSSSNDLLGVSCTSMAFCMATGAYSNTPALNDQGTLVERWSGSSWSVVSSPNPGNNGDTLDGISCPSTTSCVAVGSHASGSSFADTLVEKWNGRIWAVVPSPNALAGHYGSYLNSVSCANATFCMADGSYSYAANHNDTLTEKSG